MKPAKTIVGIVLALMLIFAGVNHFMTPDMYFPMIPDFLPKSIVNLLAGVVEVILGVGVFIPAFRKRALFGIFLLMVAFMPVHIWDAFREHPAIGTPTMALVRIGIQLVLIYLPWWASKD